MKQSLLEPEDRVSDAQDEANGKDNIGGLTTAQVEKLYEKWGYNELPTVEVPLWYVFLMQFTGTMVSTIVYFCSL